MKDAILLTDDQNPVGIWAERINIKARKEFHRCLGISRFYGEFNLLIKLD